MNSLPNIIITVCSRKVIEWTEEGSRLETSFELDHFSTATMEGTTFNQLHLRLGFPYLYCHHGNCEHLLIFRDMRYKTKVMLLIKSPHVPLIGSSVLKSTPHWWQTILNWCIVHLSGLRHVTPVESTVFGSHMMTSWHQRAPVSTVTDVLLTCITQLITRKCAPSKLIDIQCQLISALCTDVTVLIDTSLFIFIFADRFD